jgi:excisionase family DNA binding protein
MIEKAIANMQATPGLERLTKREVAARLRLSARSLERRMKTHSIAYQKDGRLVFFAKTDLAEYMANRKIRATGIPAR